MINVCLQKWNPCCTLEIIVEQISYNILNSERIFRFPASNLIILSRFKGGWYWEDFFKLEFTTCKAEQSLWGTELQEKETQKEERIQEICLEWTYS